MAGIYVGESNVQRFFPRHIKEIELQLDHLRIECRLGPHFWKDKPEISDPRLCTWLESRYHNGNGRRGPISLALIPSGRNSFIVGPAQLEDAQRQAKSMETLMKSDHAANQFEVRAAEALKALLEQISAVKLKEIRRQCTFRGQAPEILAHIDVFGHSHTLACKVNRDPQPEKLRASLRKLQDCTSQLVGQVTPVLIAPYLSPEARALCKESHAGFLDFEGNARLTVGEVFIAKRTLQRHPAPAGSG